MNLPELLPHFDSWTRSGNGRFMASCPMPAHRDSEPSVSITQDAETGKILLYCWGCNTKGHDLIQAMGMNTSVLQGDPGHPAAVRQNSQAAEASPEDQAALEQRVKGAVDNLFLAKDYILTRFGLSEDVGKQLLLGVDEDFSNTPHLIIPFVNPEGKIVAMQGRRLVDGDPRWRSVSGPGWSKIGCFGWSLSNGPVIITEGPSDALAVVGRAGLPALAVRGASNTAAQVCEQIKDWLGDRVAIVIGDNGEAGAKFTQGISEGTGLSAWFLPADYDDVCDYLAAGGSLEQAVLEATGCEFEPVENDNEKARRLQAAIKADLDLALYNNDLKTELGEVPDWMFDGICNNIIGHAGYGQRTDVRRRMTALQRAVRDQQQGAAPPAAAAGGGGLHAPMPDDFDPGHLPEIIWNPEDQYFITEASVRDAMDAYSDGRYYRSASGLYVKVVVDELVNLKEPGVKSMLSQMGHWRIVNGQRELGHVPSDAARMVSDPSWSCGLPEIKRRVEVPFMMENGEIVSSVGFHEESGVYLLPRKNDQITVPVVPAIVTDEHINEARRIFEDVTEGFMFNDHASRSNLIAMTLTSPLRELFRSNPMVPLLTSTAPQSGSGKGTSIRVPLSTAGVGPHSLATTAYNPDENEFEKKLVGKLLKKSTYIFLDNIRGNVASSVLEQMLTAANYDGRTLGYSEVNSLSTMVLWVSTLQSTGSFNRDLTRRCVPVELIKNYRGTWAHKNIEAYLASRRGEMIWACFVVARKWMQDGAPISEARLDGYGGWTEVIGGILEHVLGYDEFLGNLDDFRKHQDEGGMTIDGILERWLSLYGETPQPARMAIEDYEDPALHQLLGLRNPGSTRQTTNALMRVLDSQRGHIINNSHIWTPLGSHPWGNEGQTKLYQCESLADFEEEHEQLAQ